MMYMDWLGMVGGLHGVIFSVIVGVIFSSHSAFNTAIETIHSFHEFSYGGQHGSN